MCVYMFVCVCVCACVCTCMCMCFQAIASAVDGAVASAVAFAVAVVAVAVVVVVPQICLHKGVLTWFHFLFSDLSAKMQIFILFFGPTYSSIQALIGYTLTLKNRSQNFLFWTREPPEDLQRIEGIRPHLVSSQPVVIGPIFDRFDGFLPLYIYILNILCLVLI